MELGTYKFIRQPNQYTTKWQRFKFNVKTFFRNLFRLIVKLGVGSVTLSLVYTAGTFSSPTHVIANTIIQENVVEAPVMERIAGCESEGNRNSKGSHFDKKGNVRINKNTNGTVDVGKNQINTVWFLTAMEMNLNLLDEKENQMFADWLYANYGTEPWYSSKACWK